MIIDRFLQQLQQSPEQISFQDTIAVIDTHYEFTPTGFQNGQLYNAAGTNSGSCKLLAFAQLHRLSVLATLHCFGDYYREDVVKNPDGGDHQNIRNFMRNGWDGVKFENTPLKLCPGSV